jgi:RHS repeat-associated protein
MIRNPIEYLQGADGLLSAHYLSRLHDGEEKLIEHDTHFYHYDALGNTIALSNSFGTQVTSYTYDAFGFIRKETNGLILNPFKFVGKYQVAYDPPINMHYMRNRWYTPQIGRFTTKDPLHEIQVNWIYNPLIDKIKRLTLSTSLPLIIGINLANSILRNKDPYIILMLDYDLSPSSIERILLKDYTSPSFALYFPKNLPPYNYSFQNPINYIDHEGTGLWCHFLCHLVCHGFCQGLGCGFFPLWLASLICGPPCFGICLVACDHICEKHIQKPPKKECKNSSKFKK